MVAPGLYPQQAPRPTDSHAESAVWQALRTQLPAGWYAWHSLRVRTRKGWTREGDFVLAVPSRGLLVLEVKGGDVEQRDGRWLQNGRPMEPPPLEQAHGTLRCLLDRLRELDCQPPAYGVALCFPDVAFSDPPGEDDLRDLVLGQHHLRWLGEALPALIERALPAPRRQSGNWVARLPDLWGETWRPRLGLGHRVKMRAEERIALDASQLEVLDAIEDNQRILVEGPAGSGKTLIAREAALRFAAKGHRVLLLTFTEALALWLRESLGGVTTAPIRRFALRLLGEGPAGHVAEPAAGSPAWEDMSFRAAEVPGLDGRYDVVVIDEAQDLNQGDWLLVDALARRARLWAFYDPAQHYWDKREIPLELFPARHKLRKAQRCHPAIQALADRYVGREVDVETIAAGMRDGVIGIVSCNSGETLPKRIGDEIGRLLAQGLARNDIAVLSLRGRGAEGGIVHRERIGSHRVVAADDPTMAEHVVCDTFLRFKGLERPAIIVTDLVEPGHRQRGVRMHIAFTRALDVVRIAGTREALASDPLLPREA